MRRPAAALILIISILIAVPVFAGLIEDATEASKHGDYKTAYSLNKQLAEAGDAKAQFLLGAAYYSGEGVPQDYAEAAKWWRKAAEQGFWPAQNDLGFLYYNGWEAENLFVKGAERDHPHALNNLGALYYRGQGVPQDYAEAAKWYRKAAEKGLPEAQYNLGVMYHNGQGLSQNYVLAHLWYTLAACQYIEGKDRKMAIKNRDEVVTKMTPAQIAEAQRLAREWKPKEEK